MNKLSSITVDKRRLHVLPRCQDQTRQTMFRRIVHSRVHENDRNLCRILEMIDSNCQQECVIAEVLDNHDTSPHYFSLSLLLIALDKTRCLQNQFPGGIASSTFCKPWIFLILVMYVQAIQIFTIVRKAPVPGHK